MPLTRWQLAHSALPSNNARPRIGVADAHGSRGGIEAGADEGDDRRQLRRSKYERRHAGAGHARRDRTREVLDRTTRGGSGRASDRCRARRRRWRRGRPGIAVRRVAGRPRRRRGCTDRDLDQVACASNGNVRREGACAHNCDRHDSYDSHHRSRSPSSTASALEITRTNRRWLSSRTGGWRTGTRAVRGVEERVSGNGEKLVVARRVVCGC